MQNSFFIYVDREGKMPVLSRIKLRSMSHPYYIRYVNDTPVAYHGPKEVHARDISYSKVWNYRSGNFIPIDTITQE